MKQLVELEKKVLDLISANKSFRDKLAAAEKENNELKGKIEALEASLLKESGTTAELSTENQSICSSIDDLLESIDSLQYEEQ